MSKIVNTDFNGHIDIDYAVEPLLVHQPEGEPQVFVTGVRVRTYWDGDNDIALLGVPPTKSGVPHRGRKLEYIWLSDDDQAAVLRTLGIDASVLPVIRSLAAGPQEDED